jgi:hypothetical protein
MKNLKTKNKASVLVFATVLALGVFSCKTELLEPIPETQISDIVAFDTPERISLQVNNMYTAVKNGNFLGGRAQVYGDIRANDFINRTSNGVTGYLVWLHTINEASQNDVINMWTFAYQAINQINVFLDGMEANADKFAPPTFPANFAATAAGYVGEARFLRAVCYHYLLQFYARPYADQNGSTPGLPLRLIGEKGADNNDLPRASVAQVYDQIIADLDFAEANLPDNYGDALTRVTRAHKNTAISFKTRVYLTKGDYAMVITEANKLVPDAAPFTAKARVAHALQPTVADVFVTPQETTESIFSLPFTAQNAPGGQNAIAAYYRAPSGDAVSGTGEFGLNTSPGGIVADKTNWPETDTRRTSFVYVFKGETFLGKQPGGNPYLDKAPVMRWSEVLLNLSEALARTNAGVNPKALELLNAVRTRSTGATGARAPLDNATLIDNIMTERRIEFLGEGLRNQDIMRLMQSFPTKGPVGEVPPSHERWVWPIPITEQNANLGING